MGGRIDIKADDVAQLAHKFRVSGELELFHPVRLKAVRTPEALDVACIPSAGNPLEDSNVRGNP